MVRLSHPRWGDRIQTWINGVPLRGWAERLQRAADAPRGNEIMYKDIRVLENGRGLAGTRVVNPCGSDGHGLPQTDKPSPG